MFCLSTFEFVKFFIIKIFFIKFDLGDFVGFILLNYVQKYTFTLAETIKFKKIKVVVLNFL